MRFRYALALAAVAATPALAQTQYADSTGGFVSVHELSLPGLTRGYGRTGIDLSVGYRRADGVDLSVRAGRYVGFGSAVRLALTAGRTWPMGAGFQSRVEATGQIARGHSEGLYRDESGGLSPYAVRDRDVTADVAATVSRPVRVVGSVRLHPTLGLYGTTGVERRTIEGDLRLGGSLLPTTRGGVQVALPLSFRLFGQTASFGPTVRFPLGRTFRFETGPDGAYAGGGLRLNF